MTGDGEVCAREAFRLEGGGGGGSGGGGVWRRRRGRKEEEGGEGSVCTLVPGAAATFEVAATARDEMDDGTVRMEVRSTFLYIFFWYDAF